MASVSISGATDWFKVLCPHLETTETVEKKGTGGIFPFSMDSWRMQTTSQPADTSPYKPQRGSTAAPSPASPGTRQPNVYPPYQSGTAPVSREAQAMRYLQSSPYTAPVPYRDVPSPYRSQTGPPEARSSTPQVELLNLRPGERPRISLLPTTQDYITTIPRTPCRDDIVSVRVAVSQQPSVVPSPQQDVGQPFKKIRLGEAKPDLQQPLRIDVRESPTVYTPQVEAISPTLPSEDIALRATKEDLLQQINKVDREIAKTEQQIFKLKNKQRELEEVASKPVAKKEEKEAEQPKHQSPAQKIYADNRKKAQDAHSLLDKLGPKVELPLYNQPSDTSVYHENKRRHLTFKKRLIEYLKQQAAEKQSYDKFLTLTYSKLMSEWLRKVDKIENSAKRKAKEAKNREFFEKVFPELRKQREDKERFNRVGARIKSEADLEEIMDGLQEQEMEDKKMRSYAVIPPILLDSRQRKLKYVNNNGKLEDFSREYKERQLLNFWTTAEHEVFKEKYLQHPKNFGLIASYLDRKNVCDCVQRYYHSKKQENYKQLLRKSRHGRTRSSRNNPNAKVNNSSAASATTLVDAVLSTTGVTTRLQREQLQKQEPKETTNHVILSDSLICSGSSLMINTTSAAGVTSVSSNNTYTNSNSSANKESDKDVNAGTGSAGRGASSTLSSNAENSVKISDAKLENKKDKRRKGDKKKEELETSDEELEEPGGKWHLFFQYDLICL
ncbi:hypothetical protein RUM43_010259 [Polyplax serrata]|uniref:SANT domain-containing protein n=1 Tax=Polyplax serrata TaxID=468196 RepID=A0AAN8S0B6_POLSC